MVQWSEFLSSTLSISYGILFCRFPEWQIGRISILSAKPGSINQSVGKWKGRVSYGRKIKLSHKQSVSSLGVSWSWLHCLVHWHLQQLTDSLLEMEEEKAIWSAKEQASIKAIEKNTKLSNAEITSLSTELSEVTYNNNFSYGSFNFAWISLKCLSSKHLV